MTTASDRDTAANLARRINANHVDPSKQDEADRPPEDKSPGYADVLMSEAPPTEPDADFSYSDWELISKALEHYASCGNAGA
jgi:hypothetical protein